MTWLKVDDGFYSHDKVVSIPRAMRAASIGTWTLCGSWSADKLTDGRIPRHMVEELGGTLDAADALVKAKLWRRTRDGFVFVNWDKYQPTRDKVEQQRKTERERKAAWRHKPQDSGPPSGNVPAGHHRDTPRDTTGRARLSEHPDPDPVPSRGSTKTYTDPSVLETGAHSGDGSVDNSDEALVHRARLFGFDPIRVRGVLARALDEIPTDDVVMRVATEILAKASTTRLVDDPTGYLVTAIRNPETAVARIAYAEAIA